MNKDKILQQTVDFVKEELKNAESGHDWFHIKRVYNNALLIAQGEEVNLFIVKLAALLHDIADSKFNDGDENIGPKKAKEFLESQGLEIEIINPIVNIIGNMSYSKSLENKTLYNSLELQVVQDADRLDAIGAIGIARAFNYGGYKNRLLYDPTIKPNLGQSKEAYKKSKAPTINHFYEKLLLLKDKMNTKTAKNIALERHQFMETFLEQFYKEWGN
ncbi:MAG TPA: HD domain-containing protein [Flavobacteriia bacterium]|nr:HD domain-containing protein [Flavobacteriia bacterium]